MTKREEILRKDSCWNKAREAERVFIVLERDAAAPAAVRTWAQKRVELGMNTWADSKIQEALAWADLTEKCLGERKGLNP